MKGPLKVMHDHPTLFWWLKRDWNADDDRTPLVSQPQAVLVDRKSLNQTMSLCKFHLLVLEINFSTNEMFTFSDTNKLLSNASSGSLVSFPQSPSQFPPNVLQLFNILQTWSIIWPAQNKTHIAISLFRALSFS